MQEIQAYLSIYCIANPTDWTTAIPMLEFIHNSRPHADQKQSPFELIMGYQPPRLLSSTKVPNLEERMEWILQWWKDAQLAHEIARQRMAKRINRPLERFTEGQKVWLDTCNFQVMYNKKIRPKRNGPFQIKKVQGPLTYQLELPSTWKIYDTFHAVHLLPYNETPQYRPNEPVHYLRYWTMKKNTKWITLFVTKRTIEDNCFSLSDGKAMDQKMTHGNPQVTWNMRKKLSWSIKEGRSCYDSTATWVICINTITRKLFPTPSHLQQSYWILTSFKFGKTS